MARLSGETVPSGRAGALLRGWLPTTRKPWIAAALAIGLIKAAWLLIDATPQFFLGDSFMYLTTAHTGAIPWDRSYLYGFGLRGVAYSVQSLGLLVVLQSVAAGATALLVFVVLRAFIGVLPAVALGAALLAALDPLQLYLERTVLPDVPAMFFTGAYVTAALWVSRRPRLWAVAGLQSLSVLVIGLRASFLPLLYATSAAVPLLAMWWIYQEQPPGPARSQTMRRTGLCTLLGIVGFFWLFHTGYKTVTGAISERPPAYIHADGLFLLAFLSPVLEPEDAADPLLADLIRENEPNLTYEQRLYQMFGEEGLVKQLLKRTDRLTANRLAGEAARSALWRNPVGVAGLGWETYSGFFERPMPAILQDNLNMQVARPLPDDFRAMVAAHFGLETTPEWNARITPTKRYALQFSGWLYVILLSPLVTLAGAWAGRGRGRVVCLLLFALVSTLLASHYVLVTSLRFLLVPGGFFVPLALGILADGLWRRWYVQSPAPEN